jgi:hypothetical protein
MLQTTEVRSSLGKPEVLSRIGSPVYLYNVIDGQDLSHASDGA